MVNPRACLIQSIDFLFELVWVEKKNSKSNLNQSVFEKF